MNYIPFSETHQLNQELALDDARALRRVSPRWPSSTSLPGHARAQLRSPELDKYLEKEFLVPQLDRLAPRLWLVSTPRSSHISALHHQAARGREIILVENPHLHLVWKYNKIFIKPIPKYLLSFAFWQYLVESNAGNGDVQKAIIGLMRSYSYLIRYESDFDLAQEKGLVPKSDGIDNITWDAFAHLIATFEGYEDANASPRYSYGELRLTRLNFYSRISLGKLTFHHIDAQWGSYLNHFMVPSLIIFTIISVILNAMQVRLAAQSVQYSDKDGMAFIFVSEWFPVFALVFVGLFSTFMILFILFMFCHDIWFSRNIIKKKNNACDGAWKTSKSGVV